MSATAAAVTATWRIESAALIAGLTRLTRDVSVAEDAAQDALVAALEQWPAEGIPAKPAAWLMAVAKRRVYDLYRQAQTARRRLADLGADLDREPLPDFTAHVDHIEDDVLRLMFLTCHPVLSPESRAALTLRLVGGLTTEEIARGFLVRDSTMGQRISRAKRTLAEHRITMDPPAGDEREQRLDDVMAVIYLIYNEGYAATAGPRWMRLDLCAEALRLARMLAALEPADPEVHGLRALLELQSSRAGARTDADGRPVLLDDQDRGRWDGELIRHGLSALDIAEGLGRPVGAYTLQAAIAACHARAGSARATDWARIAGLYDLLARVAPNPVVEVNRAVAHGRAFGPDAGLAVLDGLATEPTLRDSHLLPAVRGDLLARCGDGAGAAAAFTEAAAKTTNLREREILSARARDSTPD